MGKIEQAAEFLLAARNSSALDRVALPAELTPDNLAEAYAIQHEVTGGFGVLQNAMTGGFGVIGGWKVLANADKPSLCAAIPIAYVRAPGARLPAAGEREMRVVLAVKIGASLARENAPFSLAQAEAAIAVVHPAAEIIEPRLTEAPPDSLAFVADSLAQGPLVVGHATQTWQGFDPRALTVHVRINGRGSRQHGSAEFDIPRALLWLADAAASWSGGVLVGEVVEVGLGIAPIKLAPGSRVHVAIDGLGELAFSLAKPSPLPALTRSPEVLTRATA